MVRYSFPSVDAVGIFYGGDVLGKVNYFNLKVVPLGFNLTGHHKLPKAK